MSPQLSRLNRRSFASSRRFVFFTSACTPLVHAPQRTESSLKGEDVTGLRLPYAFHTNPFSFLIRSHVIRSLSSLSIVLYRPSAISCCRRSLDAHRLAVEFSLSLFVRVRYTRRHRVVRQRAPVEQAPVTLGIGASRDPSGTRRAVERAPALRRCHARRRSFVRRNGAATEAAQLAGAPQQRGRRPQCCCPTGSARVPSRDQSHRGARQFGTRSRDCRQRAPQSTPRHRSRGSTVHLYPRTSSRKGSPSAPLLEETRPRCWPHLCFASFVRSSLWISRRNS